MQWGKIAVGALIVVIVGLGSVRAIKWFLPTAMDTRPKLVEVPPLAPSSRSSRIVIPAVITLTALREATEQEPRELSGKSEIPLGPSSAEFAWSAVRGGFGVEGEPNGLKLWTALRGSLRASAQAGALRPPEGFGPPGVVQSAAGHSRSGSGLPAPARRPGSAAIAEPDRADVRAERRDQRKRAAHRASKPAAGMARARGGRWDRARRGDRAPRTVRMPSVAAEGLSRASAPGSTNCCRTKR